MASNYGTVLHLLHDQETQNLKNVICSIAKKLPLKCKSKIEIGFNIALILNTN